MRFLLLFGPFLRLFHLVQAIPAVVTAFILDDVGEKFSHVPAPVALKQDAFRELIQFQHTSSQALPGSKRWVGIEGRRVGVVEHHCQKHLLT
jgi:hypothetical protein